MEADFLVTPLLAVIKEIFPYNKIVSHHERTHTRNAEAEDSLSSFCCVHVCCLVVVDRLFGSHLDSGSGSGQHIHSRISCGAGFSLGFHPDSDGAVFP